MYGRTDGHIQFTSGPLPVTSSPLPVHLGTIGCHMRHHSYSLPKKKNEFRKICGRTGKKLTTKDPFRVYNRDLNIIPLSSTVSLSPLSLVLNETLGGKQGTLKRTSEWESSNRDKLC